MSITVSAQSILSQNASGGDEAFPEEFWALIDRYRSDLINQAFAILGRQSDAEDVVQATFCEAFRRPEQLAKVRSVGAWLRAINRANALDVRRTRTTDNAVQGSLRRPRATTGGLNAMMVREAVAKAIDALPGELREVIVLSYWEHLDQDAIAERLKISPRTVWQRLHDAYRHLHRTLGPQLLKGPAQGKEDRHEGQ